MPHAATPERVRVIAGPVRSGETPARSPPPVLGQHAEEVPRDRLGLNAARLEASRGKGVI